MYAMGLQGDDRSKDLDRRPSLEDASSLGMLLERHRKDLRGMVAATLDARVAKRVDASDLVQEALVDAIHKLPEYLRDRERISLLAWLRQLARKRVIWASRRHLGAVKRCVARERGSSPATGSTDDSGLLGRLVDPESSPSHQAVQREELERLDELLKKLPEIDRTILRLRYAGQHPFPEIARRLNLGLSAVTMHHLRAIHKLRELM